ncbi:semaphorin-5A-like isoform X2 [Glandiceps talaboti]
MMPGSITQYLLLFLICQLSSLTVTTNELEKSECQPPVAQVLHFPDLSDVVTFEREDVTNYHRLVVDEDNSQLIVGARDNLFRLSLADLTVIEVIEWKADAEAMEECKNKMKGKSEEDCRNFIRVLLPWGNSVFVCGTYAFAPQCGWRNITSLNFVTSSVHGTSKCPYNPDHNNTALISSTGDIYSGTVTDFTARDPVIKRVYGNLPTLRTVQSNSKWLSEPNFVSSYEIGSYIYFYFRETAVEYMNCGKTIYSRVARVCKNDAGGHFLLEDNWTTFTKARLNCSLPGEFPFYFNEIQSTYYIEEENLTYAVFTTSKNSIHGSAVCVYDSDSIHEAFSGPFKYQENAQSAWVQTPNPNPDFQCDTMGTEYARPQQTVRKLEQARRYQLLDRAVQPKYTGAIYKEEEHDERLTEIVVDVVRGKHDRSFHVMFIGTESGILKKVVIPIGKTEACLVEEIHPFAVNKSKPIKTMKLVRSEGALYVGSEDSIIKIPVQRCHKYQTKRKCLDAMDPYCGWNGNLKQCTPYEHSFDEADWHQEMTSCPVLEKPSIDGEFGNWTDWRQCNNMGSEGSCLCRTRQCNNPEPQCGGQDCIGEAIQVTNCTVHGRWTDWSAWSGCSQTCGLAVKTRQRSCTNPAPQHGGRQCIGEGIEQEECELPLCVPIGRWSDWTKWSNCSKPCNGGTQHRNRNCLNGTLCTGNDIEYRGCNQHVCQEFRKSSPWSPWMIYNRSDTGYYEHREKNIFKARVSSYDDIHHGVKEEVRFCPQLNNPCVEPEERIRSLNGTWSKWSAWSPCSVSCGEGRQVRDRDCQHPLDGTPANDCEGEKMQYKMCVTETTCTVNGSWSCWLEWGECSVSCGSGYRGRYRTCTNPAPQGDGEYCQGTDMERKPCNQHRCPGKDGWHAWSSWTACGPDNLQHRYRNCSFTFAAIGQCEGGKTDSKKCIFNAIPDMEVGRMTQCDNTGMYHYKYFLLVGFACVFVSVIITGVVCYVGKKKTHKKSSTDNRDINPTIDGYSELNYKDGINNKGLRTSMASSNGTNGSSYFSNLTINQAYGQRTSGVYLCNSGTM